MGDEKEKDILERVSTLEEQVKGIGEVKNKIDVLYNLLMEMKLDTANTRSDFAMKADCSVCRKEVDAEIEKLHGGSQKLFWTMISSGFVLVVWLVEQLLHVTVHLG